MGAMVEVGTDYILFASEGRKDVLNRGVDQVTAFYPLMENLGLQPLLPIPE